MLIGHTAARAAFEAAWAGGRPHHAWLLAGPRGVGKASFAAAAARMVLADAASFDVPGDAPAARLLAAGSHPDHRVLARLPRDGDGRLAAAIVIDQVRLLQAIFQMTPGLGGWRVVTIDSIDDLNPAAANALLKSLEEPPERTLFLAVSHAPARLLPTLRSRCRKLRFGPLSDDDTREVLTANGVAPAELAELAAFAEGAPGRALGYAGLGLAGLIETLESLPGAPPVKARARALTLSRELAGKSVQPRYEAFLDLVPRHLARAATASLTGAALEVALAAWEEARDLAADAGAGTLDPAAVVLALAGLVAQQRRP